MYSKIVPHNFQIVGSSSCYLDLYLCRVLWDRIIGSINNTSAENVQKSNVVLKVVEGISLPGTAGDKVFERVVFWLTSEFAAQHLDHHIPLYALRFYNLVS